ncbi:serine/threonine protein phosphatase [Micromonospora sp. M42]|nr:serine/threonine protein phosphatase [Micromonospora sp. M42]
MRPVSASVVAASAASRRRDRVTEVPSVLGGGGGDRELGALPISGRCFHRVPSLSIDPARCSAERPLAEGSGAPRTMSVISYRQPSPRPGRLRPMTLKLRSVGASDRGLIRSGNQDAQHAGPWLVAVADGMGGMAAGDLASRIAIDAIAPLDVETPEDALVAALQGAIELATARIRQAVEEDPERQGMGTTLTALLFARTGSCLALAHVGDSRAYLFREGVLKQVTRDDTFVQMLVDQGVITAEQASSHPRRAVVTQALQGDQVSPSYATMVPRAGDRWLLCSDGLSNVVRADTLTEVLNEQMERDACAARLIDLALRAGGPDNITVVIADVVEE